MRKVLNLVPVMGIIAIGALVLIGNRDFENSAERRETARVATATARAAITPSPTPTPVLVAFDAVARYEDQHVTVEGYLKGSAVIWCASDGLWCELELYRTLQDTHTYQAPELRTRIWRPQSGATGRNAARVTKKADGSLGDILVYDCEGNQIYEPRNPPHVLLTGRVIMDKGEPVLAVQTIELVGTATRPQGTPSPAANPTPAGCVAGAKFIQDATIPDGTVLAPGEAFVKVWRVRSSGCAAWAPGTRWVFVSGAQMVAPDGVDAPETPAGETAELSVAMQAPATPGSYKGYWQMQGPDGRRFGDRAWVSIVVK